VIPDNDRSAPPTPADPITDLALGAAATHELFLSYLAAGFSEEQAIRLIAAMAAEYRRNGGEPS
jgi:hypothetical protein